MGLNFTACAPCEYYPNEELVAKCREIAAQSGSELKFTNNVEDAVKNADVIYTDIWVSMGEPTEVWDKRLKDLIPYQVNENVFKMAPKSAVFMHCLPSYHNKDTVIGKQVCEQYGLEALEVTDSIFESEHSLVFQEAENRMHTIKAIMVATIGEI